MNVILIYLYISRTCFVHIFTEFLSDDSTLRFLKKLFVLIIVEVLSFKFFYHICYQFVVFIPEHVNKELSSGDQIDGQNHYTVFSSILQVIYSFAI